MKYRIILLVLLVLVAVLGGGWWWAKISPELAAAFLVRVGLTAERARAAVDWAGGQDKTATDLGLLASGSIEGREVAIMPEFGGRVVSLVVGEGDLVSIGQVLVELDASHLLAEQAQAEAAVAVARASLAELRSGTHPAEILAAEAALDEARAERDAAVVSRRAARSLFDDPQEIEERIVQAQAAVDLSAAQIDQAEAQLALAMAERDQHGAQGSSEEKWLHRVHDFQVKAAESAVEAAKANRVGAEEMVAALQALRSNPLALVRQLHSAEAQVQIAEAGVTAAEAKLAELRASPTSEQVAVAEAQVVRAEAAASALEVQIEKMSLRSPIPGVVTDCPVHLGESPIAGMTLLKVANLDEVELAVYLPAAELSRVYLGQSVEVRVRSWPDRAFTGTVYHISQEAEFTPKNIQTEQERGNMVFAVSLRLANPEHLLKPGMPADVILE